MAGFPWAAATREIIEQEDIGVGEEVFLTGLFVSHHGRHRNLPIVRVGNIALMPGDEKVETKFGSIDAYLIEARSIGGLSGSPVFVHLGWARRTDVGIEMGNTDRFYLLGLMQGHWDLPDAEKDSVEDDLRRESVNMGIGIVVPIWDIIEVLSLPELVERRAQIAEAVRPGTAT